MVASNYTLLAFLWDVALALGVGLIFFLCLSGVGVWVAIALDRFRSRSE
jgi:uncharacterized protein involved in exopolysaccharide biosynthesis